MLAPSSLAPLGEAARWLRKTCVGPCTLWHHTRFRLPASRGLWFMLVVGYMCARLSFLIHASVAWRLRSWLGRLRFPEVLVREVEVSSGPG